MHARWSTRCAPRFDAWTPTPAAARNGARLFSRVAVVLHGLDGLPGAARAHRRARRCRRREATAAFGKLVAGLLAVVFEAADSATDPEVSRALVAMFNFMQGKEFAGQERALRRGASSPPARIDAARQQQWRHLIESQQGCFQVFADFCDAARCCRPTQASRDPAVLAEHRAAAPHRLARAAAAPLDPELSHAWYDAARRRIDAMQRGGGPCSRCTCARLCERTHRAGPRRAARPARACWTRCPAPPTAHGAAAGAPTGRTWSARCSRMVQEQSRRLQAMSDELDAVRASAERTQAGRARQGPADGAPAA